MSYPESEVGNHHQGTESRQQRSPKGKRLPAALRLAQAGPEFDMQRLGVVLVHFRLLCPYDFVLARSGGSISVLGSCIDLACTNHVR